MSEPKPETSLDREARELDLELKRLTVEDLRVRLASDAAMREDRRRIAEQRERSAESERRTQRQRQTVCPHRKGGKDLEGLERGNDANASVLKHTYPTGAVHVLCTRCLKDWGPACCGKPKKVRGTDRCQTCGKAYREQTPGYREALAMATDNEPSGAGVFQFSSAPPPGWEAEQQ